MAENRVIAFWRDLLLDLEDEGADISLSEILFFTSTLKAVPCHRITMGLSFLDDPENNGKLLNFPKRTHVLVFYICLSHTL